jgi:hypothetical protein
LLFDECDNSHFVVTFWAAKRAIPLKIQLFNGDVLITDQDLEASPVVNVLFTSNSTGDIVDLTEPLEPLGNTKEGNNSVLTQIADIGSIT